MNYQDRVYGKFEIKEPIIIEIINTPSFQRLKHIDPYGYQPLWAKPEICLSEHKNTRFAHSLGVYLLLNKYNAPLEEQIAGLIHDISHPSFSHCIDYVLKSGSEKKQNHQDNCFNAFVTEKTEIPKIIEKYGLNLEYILDNKNFPLIEMKTPDLCADRIDYSLRDSIFLKELDISEKDYFLNNLIVKDNQWVFKNFDCAKRYANLFRMLNDNYYSGLPSAIMFKAVSNCLKYALQKKYISENDFYTTDEEVIEKIKENLRDRQLEVLWKRMNDKSLAYNNPENREGSVFCKSRIVDPLFENEDGTTKRLSQAEVSWAQVVKEESQPKRYFISFR